jgi:hypothetical protein
MKWITDEQTGMIYPETHIKPARCFCKKTHSQTEKVENKCSNCNKKLTYDI